jgi:hypothetical protein
MVREIDPLYLLAFLLEKMHKELNKVDEKKSFQLKVKVMLLILFLMERKKINQIKNKCYINL